MRANEGARDKNGDQFLCQTQRIRKNAADVVDAIVPVTVRLLLFTLKSSSPTVGSVISICVKLDHSVSVRNTKPNVKTKSKGQRCSDKNRLTLLLGGRTFCSIP